MSIGKNIRNKRLECNMSQDELASQLFVTRQTISNYEGGKRDPSIETLTLMTTIFHCEIEELIYGGNSQKEIKSKQKKYLLLIFVLFILFMSVSLISNKIEILANNKYYESAFVVSKSLLFYPLILGTIGYVGALITKLYNQKIMINYKWVKVVIIAIIVVYLIDNGMFFLTLAFDNLRKISFPQPWTLSNITLYWPWWYAHGLTMNVGRFLFHQGISINDFYVFIDITSVMMGVLLAYTKKHK